ncbi:hypothetical protein HK100_007204, partial [Physocladia obscura]
MTIISTAFLLRQFPVSSVDAGGVIVEGFIVLIVGVMLLYKSNFEDQEAAKKNAEEAVNLARPINDLGTPPPLTMTNNSIETSNNAGFISHHLTETNRRSPSTFDNNFKVSDISDRT